MNVHLQKVFSYDEVREAFQALPKHSCLGIDGVIAPFFLKYWDLIKVDLCTTYQHFLHDGCMPSHFYLIPTF